MSNFIIYIACLVGKMFVAGIAIITDEEIDNITQEKALSVIDALRIK